MIRTKAHACLWLLEMEILTINKPGEAGGEWRKALLPRLYFSLSPKNKRDDRWLKESNRGASFVTVLKYLALNDGTNSGGAREMEAKDEVYTLTFSFSFFYSSKANRVCSVPRQHCWTTGMEKWFSTLEDCILKSQSDDVITNLLRLQPLKFCLVILAPE